MPSVSKDQQAASSIALKAKKEGTIDKLPKKSASYQMATSMSIKELEKFAGTKRKGLPKKKKNESMFSWGGNSLNEVFSEEMLDTDDDGEAISSDKNRREQLTAAKNDTEDDTGWDDYDALWATKVATNPTQGGNSTGMNAMGVSRVGFESKNYNPNSLDILFEQDYGYEHDYDDQAGIARSEIQGEELENIEEKIADVIFPQLDTIKNDPTVSLFSAQEPEPPSKQLTIELVEAYLSDLSEEGRTMSTLVDIYGHHVPESLGARWMYAFKEYMAKRLGEQIWEQWIFESGFMEPRTETDEHMLDDMVKFLVNYEYNNDYSPSEWTPDDLLGDFNYEYQVDTRNKKDLDVARDAIEKASKISAEQRSGTYRTSTTMEGTNRWQKLAGILVEKKGNKKWMQGATNPKEKGELSKKLGIPEKDNIPMSLLLKKKKALQAKGEGDKKLSKSDRETLDQIIFAINSKNSKKKKE